MKMFPNVFSSIKSASEEEGFACLSKCWYLGISVGAFLRKEKSFKSLT